MSVGPPPAPPAPDDAALDAADELDEAALEDTEVLAEEDAVLEDEAALEDAELVADEEAELDEEATTLDDDDTAGPDDTAPPVPPAPPDPSDASPWAQLAITPVDSKRSATCLSCDLTRADGRRTSEPRPAEGFIGHLLIVYGDRNYHALPAKQIGNTVTKGRLLRVKVGVRR